MTREQLYLEDIEIGSVWNGPSQTISESHFRDFAGLTGDFNPIHIDEEYASETQFGRRVAHGMLITSLTVVGATDLSPHLHESMIAFLSQKSTFHEPVFIGDTVFPQLTVTNVEPKAGTGIVTLKSEVHNQDDDLILDGELRLLVESRSGR
ncbi:MaoC family dehydratase [Saliphagus sp. GCM10025308]